MHVSTRSRYGLRLLLDVARHQDEGPVNIGSIATRQGLSQKYMDQIIKLLKRGGFLKSRRGCQGGLRLTRPAADIHVGELVRSLEGKRALTACTEASRRCNPCRMARGCPARRLWKEAGEAMFAYLDGVSLAEVLSWGLTDILSGEPAFSDSPMVTHQLEVPC